MRFLDKKGRMTLLENIMDHLPVGIYILKDDTPLFFNDTFCEMVGYDRDDVASRPLRDLLDMTPRGAENARDIYEKIKNREIPEHIWDNPLVRPDGSGIILRGIVKAIDIKGETAVLVVLRDITQQRGAERKLREQAELFRLIGENSADFIYVHDTMSRLSYVSPGVERITGYTTDEWMRWAADFVVDGPMKDHTLEATRKALETGVPQPAYTVEIRAKDGRHRILEVHESPFKRDGEVAGIVGVARDITERLEWSRKLERMNRELEKRNVELERANREMEAFIYTVSHDLKAPLVTLHGMTDRLIRKVGDSLDKKARHYLDRIIANIERLEELVLDLLELSRIGRIEDRKEIFDAVEALEDAKEAASEIIREKHLEIYHPPSLGLTEYSRKRLQQVFTNLLTNAAKYGMENRNARLKIESRRENGFWLLTFTDNGRGIDPKFREKIFQAFQRPGSRKEDEGSGIGLTVVKRIVEFNGGRIWVTSEPGKGSTFHLTIPAVSEGMPDGAFEHENEGGKT